MQSREERTEQIGTKQCITTEHFTFSLGLGTVLCHLERKIASKTLQKGGGGGRGKGVLRTRTTLCVYVCWGKVMHGVQTHLFKRLVPTLLQGFN